jgi:hypothetical protein
LVQIFSSAPCSQTPLVYVPTLNVRDHVSHPYRITGKIIIFPYKNVWHWKCGLPDLLLVTRRMNFQGTDKEQRLKVIWEFSFIYGKEQNILTNKIYLIDRLQQRQSLRSRHSLKLAVNFPYFSILESLLTHIQNNSLICFINQLNPIHMPALSTFRIAELLTLTPCFTEALHLYILF